MDLICFLQCLGYVMTVKEVMSSSKNLINSFKENYKIRKVFNQSLRNINIIKQDLNGEDKNVFNRIFSQENIKHICRVLEDEQEYDFEDRLREELHKGLTEEEKNNSNIEYYIEIFINDIKENIKIQKLPLENKIIIKEMKKSVDEGKKGIKNINKSINDIIRENNDISLYRKTLEDIEMELLATNEYGIGLDFFDYGENEVDSSIKESIRNNQITYISSKNKLEGLYYVLRILKYTSKTYTYIVDKKENWNKVVSVCESGILIPFFEGEFKINYGKNKIVKILDSNEVAGEITVIKIPERLKANLYSALSRYIVDPNEVNSIVEKAAGNFYALKSAVFSKSIVVIPNLGDNRRILLKAMLLGGWTENEGDKEIIEKYVGLGYDSFISKLEVFMKEPFSIISKHENFSETQYMVAMNEDILEKLLGDLGSEDLKVFCDIAENIFLDLEACKWYEEQNLSGIKLVNCGRYSDLIKVSIIRNVIFLCLKHDGDSININIQRLIKNIIDKIINKSQWKYILEYLPGFVEASPYEVLEKLKSVSRYENNDFFEIYNENKYNPLAINYRNYILISIEMIMNYRSVSYGGIEVLINMLNNRLLADHSKKDTIDVLAKPFNIYKRCLDLNTKEVCSIFDDICKNREIAWLLIKRILPNSSQYQCINDLHKFRYRKSFVTVDVSEVERIQLMNRYFDQSVELAKDDIKKISYILFNTNFLRQRSITELMSNLLELISCTQVSDQDKFDFEMSLRNFVYMEKLYKNSQNSYLNNLEELVQKIKYSDRIYKYLYIFRGNDVKTLKPYKELKEFESQLWLVRYKQLKTLIYNKRYSLFSMQSLVNLADDTYVLGANIAKIQDDGEFSYKIIKCAYANYKYSIIRGYIETIYNRNEKDDNKLIYFTSIIDDPDLKALVLSDVTPTDLILKRIDKGGLNELKYWENVSIADIKNNKELDEYCIRKMIEKYIFNEAIEKLIFNKYSLDLYLLILEKIKTCPNKIDKNIVSSWRIEQLFKKIYSFDVCYRKRELMASYELYFIGIFDPYYCEIKPKFLYEKFDESPELLAHYIICMYRKEENIDYNVVKNVSIFLEQQKYCPYIINAHLEGDKIEKWFERFFIEIKKYDDYEDIGMMYAGKIVAKYPLNEEGLPMDEVCSIIKVYSNEIFKSEFICQVFNSRGTYICDYGASESKLAKKYKDIEERIPLKYYETKVIFRKIAAEYNSESKMQRERGVYHQ